MAGMEFMDDIPFKDVLFNGLVRDDHGRKMSKSLGNGIDPLEMIDLYSADAVRFTLVMLSSEGQDINLSRKNFEMGRNFSNKIWNAYRFLNINLDTINPNFEEFSSNFELVDKWILSRYFRTVDEMSKQLDTFRINDALNSVYHFFWHDYCDWYLEMIKQRLYQNTESVQKDTALSVASFIMKGCMELLHPFVPFITEEIWQAFKQDGEKSVVTSKWPEIKKHLLDKESEQSISLLQDVVSAIRNLRIELKVPVGKKIAVFIKAGNAEWEKIHLNENHVQALAKVEKLSRVDRSFDKADAGTAVIRNIEIFIPMADLVDKEKERERLNKEFERLSRLETALKTKLNNKNFLEKAPENVIEKERSKLKNIQENLEKVKENYEKFKD
jgi:valyl-tRNA synthetase